MTDKQKEYIEKSFDGSGFMYVNKFKNTATHPDMTGYIKIDGKIFQVSAWHKTGFTNLRVKEYIEPEPKTAKQTKTVAKPKPKAETDKKQQPTSEDLPF